MAQSFAELMKNRKKDSEKLAEAVNNLDKKQNNSDADERFWQPSLDESDRGSAVIRLLPAPKGEDLAFVKLFNHAFQGPGGWYIENCLSTIGKDDPVLEFNSKLWDSKTKAGEEQGRKQKRNLFYYSNVLVLKDPLHPENEGKVFLFRYGKKIMDKIKEKQFPEFGEDPINPFDLLEGLNFKMKLTVNLVNGKKMRNYDACSFDDTPSALLGGDEDKMMKVWESEYSLNQFLKDDQFKDYETLRARLKKVLELDDEDLGSKSKKPAQEAPKSEPKAPAEKAPEKEEEIPFKVEESSDDDDENFFKNLIDD